VVLGGFMHATVPDSRADLLPAYCEVALPIPVERGFTYAVPESLRERVAVGMRVLVRVKNRFETGYVTGVSGETSVESVKPIIDLPDDGPMFSAEMIALCTWISNYYCCSLGEALQCASPPGAALRAKRRYSLCHEQINSGRYTDRQRKVVAALHRRGPLTEGQLAKEVGATALSNTLQALVKRGLLIEDVETLEPGVTISMEPYIRLREDTIPSAADLEILQRRAPKQAAVYLDLLNGEPAQPVSALYDRHRVNSAAVRALLDKGLVERFERERYRTPDIAFGPSTVKHQLNDGQQAAYEAIRSAMDAREYQSYLLKGITGSGKTEVYLQAIEHALELGRDAIVLVPEIALTPQTVGRFKSRFEENIAVLHSGLGPGERYDEWRRAQRGEVRIVVGARSAVFAPLKNVGIIVVDEEHDQSYKQSDAPRYHARDVAIVRARHANAVCVLGSATPSIESFYNTRAGKSVCLELKTRATDAALPSVELVDMRVETQEIGVDAILSRRLEDAVHQRVAAGEQVLLLLNRRGFAPFVLCPSCGWCAECPDCNVSLTYHAKGAFLSCHYCNGKRDVPGACEECSFSPLLQLGTGTQKVEDYLLRSFPTARIERMDADTTAGKGGHAKILGRLAQGDIDILVGTQMIAKGHDYPGVTLVGVLNADTGLTLPDFRAAETAFQLLTQVAGRAGRGGKPGEVIVQTYRPKHYAVQAAAQHDYDRFFQEEVAHREGAGYPPVRKMANIMVESEDSEIAARGAQNVQRLAREHRDRLGIRQLDMLGPAPATVRRVKKKYRWNLALLAPTSKALNAVCRGVRDSFADLPFANQAQLKIDLDPHGIY
jgi:primosomal protein N' (replication factor Y) (superfamily II helicase)